tara:strand:+ start:904 stop:1146 length:243 start_codon:yes stop_codon:yes gene_type:complete
MTETIIIGQGHPVTSVGDLATKSDRLKAERNSRLADSDFMMVSDRGLTDAKKAKWATYRQALRDMDFSDPDNITWPTKPK